MVSDNNDTTQNANENELIDQSENAFAQEEQMPGTIKSKEIRDTHTQTKKVVSDFVEIQKIVNKRTSEVKDNWVGLGENAFDSEVKILINKIEDIGDMLKELYDGLVKAETMYTQLDDDIRKEFVKARAEANNPEYQSTNENQSSSIHSSGTSGTY